jgi:large subunit ribosomal protein L22
MAFGVKTNERPGTRCVVRHVRMSATKARAVLDLVRGKTVREAAEILAFTERGAAEVVAKALNSAVANAITNDGQVPEELYVSACFADEGPTLKRWRPRARGRATRIRKRTCHVTLIVSRLPDDVLARQRAADAARSAGRRGRTAQDAAEARRRRVSRSRGEDPTREAEPTPAAEEPTAEETAQDQADESASAEVVDEDAAADVTERIAEDGDAEAADDSGEDAAEGEVEESASTDDAPYGEGSAAPLEDGSGPEGYDIKGNVDSMLYHTPQSRYYGQTKAEVYFATSEAAEAAGFSAPPSVDDEGPDNEGEADTSDTAGASEKKETESE